MDFEACDRRGREVFAASLHAAKAAYGQPKGASGDFLEIIDGLNII